MQPKFKFVGYSLNPIDLTAYFNYHGADGLDYCETIQFAKPAQALPYHDQAYADILDGALQLAFVLIGISYYKSSPTTEVELPFPIDQFQAEFFSTVYQDGLSQFAFTNHLTRANLATFTASPDYKAPTSANSPLPSCFTPGALITQSGGKDSLLTTKIDNGEHSYWYLSSSLNHPALLDELDRPLQLAVRSLDRANLVKANGLNGHVPVTYIVQSLALVQAIINRQTAVLTSIGQEGAEAHAVIRTSGQIVQGTAALEPTDLAVNHQWSKTFEAEQLFRTYIKNYISKDLDVYSPLRNFTELKIAELFTKHCWPEYGHRFSSCNVANYAQGNDNHELKWCGHCAKCANSYLLFAPFIPRTELDSLFGGRSLFEDPELHDDFQGLLGVNDRIKPFECVGEVSELRYAYHHRLPEYPALPFEVPPSSFNPERPLSV